MVKVGIIGGAGYTAGELIRLLVNHPEVEIVFIHSTSNGGNLVSEVHGGLYGECDLRFSEGFSRNDFFLETESVSETPGYRDPTGRFCRRNNIRRTTCLFCRYGNECIATASGETGTDF